MSRKLRRALDGVLRNWGHDVMLQRKNPDGRGFQSKLERHTVRHRYPAVRGLPQIAQERPEGMTHVVDMVYYFNANARPREGDRIYEFDTRYDGMDGEVDDYGQSTWLIDYAIPMRGKGGQVIFWATGVTREEPN